MTGLNLNMKKLGVLVGERGDWKFFREIFDEFDRHYQTIVFKEKHLNIPLLYGRLNRWIYQNGIRDVLKKSDLCFFEWASELLVEATHMPKYCPIVTRLHSYELYAWAPKVNWDHVDRIIFVSQAMRDKFVHDYPAHASKTEVVYIASSTERFTPVEHNFGFNLGMLCSIHPRKRIYEVIMMVNNLKEKGYQPKLHIAGGRIHGGDLDEYYIATLRLVEKLNLQNDVKFYDHVAEPASWLGNMDIFISNSYWEGLQTSLVEAMAAGCYCLSHFWDGADEALPTENIYSDENELQRKIIDYYNLPDEEKLKRKSRMRITACEQFNIDKNKLRICEILDEIADGK